MRAVLALGLALVSACSGRGAAVWVTTGDQQKLLTREPDLSFSAGRSADLPVIEVADTGGFQEMVGFGASITDASAILINGLPAEQRDLLLRDLFDPDSGIGLSFTRLTIGASDFSPNHYTFDDMPRGQRDPLLARFSIEPDRANRLPVVRRARAINPALTVMGSPWSAPAWMKTSDRLIKGSLRSDAYEAFAEYLARYVDAYAAEGVPIFALTIQNEPHFEPDNYPGMRVEPAARARFIGGFLGPRLARGRGRGRGRGGSKTLIFDWDHNWDEPQSPLAVLKDSVARSYIDGVAWHCYGGDVTAQSIVHDSFPAVDTYFTECSGGAWAPKFADNLVWNVQQLIIGTTRNWARGVLLWNLALDETHGPHLGGCGNCRGVVTIDSKSGAITRNVEYYALAHASRFVKPGARRVVSSGPVEGLENVAFRNPDRSSVLIVVNTTGEQRQFSVRWRGRGLEYVLPPSAVATFRWSD